MKLSSQQYAQALIEVVADKDKKGAKSAIDNFIKLLAQNNDLKLADEICRQLEIISSEREGILKAEVSSVKNLGAKAKNSVKDYIKQETGASKINLENKVDKLILGGLIIKYGDKIVDSSLKNKLAELRQQLIK